MTIKDIRLVSSANIGAALYCIVPETLQESHGKSDTTDTTNIDDTIDTGVIPAHAALHTTQTFLLGLGLWDRVNSPHTLGVKDATKGQVIRVDAVNDLISASAELSNIIYQISPLDDGRIFVGCRNGDLMYLNHDLSINKHIDLDNKGLYFFVRNGNNLIATMREGSILFYDMLSEKSEVLQVVDKDIRMWPIIKDDKRILAGSYRGHLVEIVDKEIISIRNLPTSRSAIWTLNRFNGQYLAGTATGELWSLDDDLWSPNKVLQCDTGITYTQELNKDQLAIGTIRGDILILNKDYSTIRYNHPEQEKVSNTIWSIANDKSHNLMRVGYSNGQLKTFRLD